MATKTLTLTLLENTVPIVGKRVTLRRKKFDYSSAGHEAPFEYSELSDDDGVVTFENVWCTSDGQIQVEYECELPNGEKFTFPLSPTSPATIEEIRGLENPPLETSTEILQGLVDDAVAYNRRAVTNSTDTLLLADNRSCVDVTRAAPGATVTLPNSFAVGYVVEIAQLGLGQVTLSPASGASLRHPDDHTKTRDQYSVVSLRVISNSGGSSAEWLLSGDTSA